MPRPSLTASGFVGSGSSFCRNLQRLKAETDLTIHVGVASCNAHAVVALPVGVPFMFGTCTDSME